MTLTAALFALVYLCALILQPAFVYRFAVLYDMLCVLSGQKLSCACE